MSEKVVAPYGKLSARQQNTIKFEQWRLLAWTPGTKTNLPIDNIPVFEDFLLEHFFLETIAHKTKTSHWRLLAYSMLKHLHCILTYRSLDKITVGYVGLLEVFFLDWSWNPLLDISLIRQNITHSKISPKDHVLSIELWSSCLFRISWTMIFGRKSAWMYTTCPCWNTHTIRVVRLYLY